MPRDGACAPYVVMAHNPIVYFGVNSFILDKEGKSEEVIDDIAKCYRHIYQSHIEIKHACRRILEDVPQSPERDAILKFIKRKNYDLAARKSFGDFDDA